MPTITILKDDGTSQEIEARCVDSGLAVHKSVRGKRGWVVSIASLGLSINLEPNFAAATSLVTALKNISPNWEYKTLADIPIEIKIAVARLVRSIENERYEKRYRK